MNRASRRAMWGINGTPSVVRIARLLAVLALSVLALLCSGCQTLRQPEEAAWQTLHVVDMLQTVDGMRDSCVREAHPLTRALIGSKPRTKEIIAYGAGAAYLHLFVSDVLRDQGMDRAYKVWQFVSIADTAWAVGQNHGIGIRIGRRNKTGCNS